jgi:hypothetical protein
MSERGKYKSKFGDMSELVIKNLERYPIVIAVGMCGVSEKSYYRWREAGINDREAGLDTPKSRGYEKVIKARANRCAALYDIVDDAGKVQGQWTAAMRLLEAAIPKTFARNAYELQQLEEMRKSQQEMNDKVDKFIEDNQRK